MRSVYLDTLPLQPVWLEDLPVLFREGRMHSSSYEAILDLGEGHKYNHPGFSIIGVPTLEVYGFS